MLLWAMDRLDRNSLSLAYKLLFFEIVTHCKSRYVISAVATVHLVVESLRSLKLSLKLQLIDYPFSALTGTVDWVTGRAYSL